MNDKYIQCNKLEFEGLAKAFYAGCGCIAVADKDNKYSFLNAKGREICPERWDSIRPFSDGLALVHKREGWGYINSRGQMALPYHWYKAEPFHAGFALVTSIDGRTIIDKQGNTILRDGENWKLLSSFHDGLALVGVEQASRRGLKGIFGGKKVRHSMPTAMYSFDIHDFGDYKFGFVDMQGNMVIKPTLDGAKKFSEGLAAVCRCDNDGGEKWGYMDARGNMVVTPQWTMAEDFHEGCAIVLDDGVLLDLIDRSGRPAFNMRCSGFSSFQGGLATFGRVAGGTENMRMCHGIINRSGEIVLEAVWEDCFPVDFGGLYAVKDGYSWKLINAAGTIVSDGWDELNLSEDGIGLGRRGGEWWIIRAADKNEAPLMIGAGEEQENES